MTLLVSLHDFAPVNFPLLRLAAAKLVDLDSAELYDLAVCLGASEAQASPIWKKLLADGFIVEAQDGRHLPTSEMHRLAQARLGKPLRRERAAQLIKTMVANAQKLNMRGPEEPYYYVSRLAVFGSYLDQSKAELGDLDVAWDLFERPGTTGYANWCRVNSVDPQAATRALVRPRSPAVRLTSLDELSRLDCPFLVVYEFDSPAFKVYVEQTRLERQERLAVHLNLMKAFSDAFKEPAALSASRSKGSLSAASCAKRR